jgi:hypothetical protein
MVILPAVTDKCLTTRETGNTTRPVQVVSAAVTKKRKGCTMNRTKIWGALTMAIAVVLLLTSCMTTNAVRVLPRVGVPSYPPTDPATILVLRAEPSQPYEVLGQIIIEPEADLPASQIDQMLRQEAARMGAHAVVIVSDMTMRVGESREEMKGGQVVAANAIRYKD